MKLRGQRGETFHGHETSTQHFQNIGKCVKRALRASIGFIPWPLRARCPPPLICLPGGGDGGQGPDPPWEAVLLAAGGRPPLPCDIRWRGRLSAGAGDCPPAWETSAGRRRGRERRGLRRGCESRQLRCPHQGRRGGEAGCARGDSGRRRRSRPRGRRGSRPRLPPLTRARSRSQAHRDPDQGKPAAGCCSAGGWTSAAAGAPSSPSVGGRRG